MQLNHSVAPRLKRNGSTDAQRAVIRNGLGIGLATGAYGLSFGALAISDGLSIAQACVLSLLMFTGGSQFAFVGVVGAGGSPLAAAAAAALLGSRNALYGLHLARLLRLRGVKKFATAQLVIDESSAMAMGSTSGPLARAGFWSAGLGVFVFWNIATLLGALGARFLSDPGVFGLDVVGPAAFLALIAPRLRSAEGWTAALLGAGVALASVSVLPTGTPMLVAAVAALALALWMHHRETRPQPRRTGSEPDASCRRPN
jgi:4-azaleucine resistance transporter AzlC